MVVETKRRRSFTCTWLPSAILLSTIFFIGTSLLLTDYKENFLGCYMNPLEVKRSKICEKECSPDGTEALPKGIVVRTTDLEMRPLFGPPKTKSKPPMNLLALAVGIKQMQNVNKIVKKFRITDFAVMLFHYDGNVDKWRDLEWSDSAVHVSAINQTKWWFAKRFLHPDIVAAYDYVFLWDEDLGVEHFHVGRYLSIVKREGLRISQPAIDGDESEVHYKLTARETNSTLHRRSVNLRGKGPRCYENSMEPPCTGFVEMMAPVFSRESWRCAWHMIQNDLVHGWGLDFQLGYCAQGNRSENIGVVDSEYLIHLGIPSLGGSADGKTNAEVDRLASMQSTGNETDVRTAVRRAAFKELDRFKNRWRKAVKEDECWNVKIFGENMAASSAPLSPLSLSLSISLKPRPQQYLLAAQKPFSPLSPPLPHSRRLYNLNLPEAFTSKATKRWEISAFNSDFSISEAENSQEIVAASGDDGVSTIISSLLLIAFVGLTILTIGVIYIAVTDFLTKREREKFEKEEAAKKKKGGKKGKVRARARAGPRGFGQKIQEEDDDDVD